MWKCKRCGCEVLGWDRNIETFDYKVNKKGVRYKGKKGEATNVTKHDHCDGNACTNCSETTDGAIETIAIWVKE